MPTELYHVIDGATLKKKIDEKGRDLQIWNVLSKEAFKVEENIPGSKWLPVDILDDMVDIVNVEKNEEIVLYCGGKDCTASKRAAEILNKHGFSNVLLYEGGLQSWKESKYPLAHGDRQHVDRYAAVKAVPKK